MLNQGGVTITQAGNIKMILADSQLFYSLPCKIANTGLVADGNGKKIIKTGTPLSGDILNRETAFTVSKKDDTNVIGILLSQDIDVTSGTKNGTVLLFGFVDETKLDASVVTLLDVANTDTSKVRSKLKQITFVK